MSFQALSVCIILNLFPNPCDFDLQVTLFMPQRGCSEKKVSCLVKLTIVGLPEQVTFYLTFENKETILQVNVSKSKGTKMEKIQDHISDRPQSKVLIEK